MAEVLVYANAGIHSHGAVRAWDACAERIQKAAPTANRSLVLRKPGSARQFYMPTMPPDRSRRKWVWNMPSKPPSKWRCGGRYQPDGSRRRNLLFCAAGSPRRIHWHFDVPVRSNGGAVWRRGNLLPYKPLAFAAPGEGDEILTFDISDSILQAWGKVLDARSRNMSIRIPGRSIKTVHRTTQIVRCHALLPAAGPKGYGLMMMIDVLSGILLGLPFGRQVSSMYDDLHAGRNLGQLHIVINPNFFSSSELFRQHLSQTMRELNAITPRRF